MIAVLVPRAWVFASGLAISTLLAPLCAQAQGPSVGDVYEGAASCGSGQQFYRISIEPGQERGRVVLDFLDAPGGRPWARYVDAFALGRDVWNTHGTLMARVGNPMVRFGPLDPPEWPETAKLQVSEGGNELTSPDYGSCSGLLLKRTAAVTATGGIQTAEDLPPVMTGKLGCYGRDPSARMELQLIAEDERSVAGKVVLRSPALGPSIEEGSFSVFGEFADGTLTLIKDKWTGRGDHGFDFTGILRDGGRRLSARASSGGCDDIDLYVPGGDPVNMISRPASPPPIREWEDSRACAALVDWARPALAQIKGNSFYSGVSGRAAREIGIGLLVESRFVPIFGKPYEALTSAEKKHLADIAYDCARQGSFSEQMRRTGASQFADDFFRRDTAELALLGSKLRLQQKRLAREVAKLEAQEVGADDIPSLERLASELESRYQGLWPQDLRDAQDVIAAKIELARGALAERIRKDIESLPKGWGAFGAEARLRKDIARTGDQNSQSLSEALDRQLSTIAEVVLVELAKEVPRYPGTLQGLTALRARLDRVWPILSTHLGAGAGLHALQTAVAGVAAATSPAFRQRAESLMMAATNFDEREARYRDVIQLLLDVRPAVDILAPAFREYDALVSSLKPELTREDLVNPDGSPTAMGLKIATGEYLNDYFRAQASIFPGAFSQAFGMVNQLVRLNGVRNVACRQADSEGYWCQFTLNFDDSLPFSAMLGLSPSAARVVFRDGRWIVLELPSERRQVSDDRFWSEVEAQNELTRKFNEDIQMRTIENWSMMP